jgi:hypothetical protein
VEFEVADTWVAVGWARLLRTCDPIGYQTLEEAAKKAREQQ